MITAVPADTLKGPMGEGFYLPEHIALPSGVEEGLRAVVRVEPGIRFRVMLYASAEEARTYRNEMTTRKEFLPDGGVIWNTPIDTATLGIIADNPIAQVQPGLAEISRLDWRDSCSSFPCTLLTAPLSGTGTGVAVGRHTSFGVLIATPYHVARESIERHRRTDGVYELQPVNAPDVRIGIDTNGYQRPGGYIYSEEVTLLANASEKDWQQGQDWALLAIPEAYGRYLDPVFPSAGGSLPGDTLWAAGFPYRSIREGAAIKDYTNAEDELRISVGRTVPSDSLSGKAVAPTDIVNTMDAVNGNSGSPVFDSQGRLLGMIRDGYCPDSGGELNLRIAQYCGVTLIVPLDSVRKLLNEK